jgi:tRNA(Ile)-lysidine synthase
MASSRKSNRNSGAGDLVSHVRDRLKNVVCPADRLVLGLSGGVDSTVLLHVLASLRDALRFELGALHVNHHISPHSGEWAAFCHRMAETQAVTCRVVDVNVARGNSLERAARDARYEALRSARADHIALAHNLDDQAETVLLQLIRGAGVRGLAGMPLVRLDTTTASEDARAARILRPLTAVPRADIERYAIAHGLAWLEDESNEDTELTRNWLRHEIIPLLANRMPGVRATLARAAANMGDAAALLDDLARIDGGSAGSRAVRVESLRSLSPPRAKNLLRFQIAGAGWPLPSSRRLEEALRQALEARRDATVHVDLGACELRRHAGALYLLAKSTGGDALRAHTWRGEEAISLPAWGTLTMNRTRGEGLSAARLDDAEVSIRPRAGGERLQPQAGRPRRTVKNLLQEAGVPPWERERLPYIHCGERLVCVPGVAIDCAFEARGGEPSIVPVWRAADHV